MSGIMHKDGKGCMKIAPMARIYFKRKDKTCGHVDVERTKDFEFTLG
jgi:hypothetical protein